MWKRPSSDIISDLTNALGGLRNIITWCYKPGCAVFEVQEVYLLECERFQTIMSLDYIEHRIDNNTVLIKTKDSEGLIEMMNEVVLVKSNDSTTHIRRETYQDDLKDLRTNHKNWWRNMDRCQYFMNWHEILKYTPSEQYEYWTYIMHYRVLKIKYEMKRENVWWLTEAILDFVRDFRMVDSLQYVNDKFDHEWVKTASKTYQRIQEWMRNGMDIDKLVI